MTYLTRCQLIPEQIWSGLRAILLALVVALVAAGCGSTPFTLEASGPFAYSAVDNPYLERVAIIVTITNRSGDDLQISPADFVARDADHNVYTASPTAIGAGASSGTAPVKLRRSLPLSTMTVRGNDVLSGYVVFDVPVGVRPIEIVWRQVDTDVIATLSSAQ